MNNNKWITDRLPTEDDADDHGYVWVTEKNGNVCHMMWDCVVEEPWMHFTRPEPYVKPKRYMVTKAFTGGWSVFDTTTNRRCCGCIPTSEAAERIAAIYEEVAP